MQIQELIDYIHDNNIPGTAEIFIYADHGQDDERAYDVNLTRSNLDDDYDILFEYNGYDQDYDDDDLEDYDRDGEITAICIYGE